MNLRFLLFEALALRLKIQIMLMSAANKSVRTRWHHRRGSASWRGQLRHKSPFPCPTPRVLTQKVEQLKRMKAHRRPLCKSEVDWPSPARQALILDSCIEDAARFLLWADTMWSAFINKNSCCCAKVMQIYWPCVGLTIAPPGGAWRCCMTRLVELVLFFWGEVLSGQSGGDWSRLTLRSFLVSNSIQLKFSDFVILRISDS